MMLCFPTPVCLSSVCLRRYNKQPNKEQGKEGADEEHSLKGGVDRAGVAAVVTSDPPDNVWQMQFLSKLPPSNQNTHITKEWSKRKDNS